MHQFRHHKPPFTESCPSTAFGFFCFLFFVLFCFVFVLFCFVLFFFGGGGGGGCESADRTTIAYLSALTEGTCTARTLAAVHACSRGDRTKVVQRTLTAKCAQTGSCFLDGAVRTLPAVMSVPMSLQSLNCVNRTQIGDMLKPLEHSLTIRDGQTCHHPISLQRLGS